MRRDLLLVSGGYLVSTFGTALTAIALLFAVRDAGPFAVVGVLVARTAPISLGAPLAGWLVDRLPNRRLMIIAMLGQALATAGVALALGRLPVMLGLLFLLGCGTAVAQPAASALVPAIAGEARATRAYATLATGRQLGTLVGASAGSLLVAALGSRGALLTDAATYAVQAAVLLLVRAERRPVPSARGATGALAGLRHLRGDPVLLATVGGFALVAVAVLMVDIAKVFYVTGVLRGGPVTLGLLQAAWLVGVLAGGRLAGRLGGQRGPALGLGVSCVVIGLAVLLPALAPVAALAGVGFGLGGLSDGVLNVCQQALVRARTPDALRGRTFAAVGAVLNTAVALGLAAGGAVVEWAGARATFGIAGVAAVVAGAAMLLVIGRATVREQHMARTG